VPHGTIITDKETGDYIGELSDNNRQIVVARGGLGGRGNAALRTAGEKSGASPPQGGEKRWLKLELKLVADIGLVGVPNAGKSTLLDAITNARPKIASYPFTTIVPNLGVCEVGGTGSVANGGDTMIIADIPGLLEGAHKGVGLGKGFLRHVERCKMIIHIVDGNSIDPVGDFNAVNRELQLFSPLLATKPQVVVLNKIDLPLVQSNQNGILDGIRNSINHSRILTISAAGRIGLVTLVERSHKFLLKLKKDEQEEKEKEEEDEEFVAQ
jgi:GTP-binding protein